MAMLFERCLAGVAGGCCALDHLGLTSTGLGPEGVLGVASWLGRAAQLVELDLLLPYTKGSIIVYDMSTRNPFEYPCNVAADISPAPAVLSARRRYVNLSEYAIPGRVVLAVSVVPVERRFSWRCTRRVRSSPAAVLLLNVIIHA